VFMLLLCVSYFMVTSSFSASRVILTTPTKSPKYIKMIIEENSDKIKFTDDMPSKFKLRDDDTPQTNIFSANMSLAPVEVSSIRESATFGSLTIGDLQARMVPRESTKPYSATEKWPEAKKIDLNGINPISPLLFSIFPALMSYAGYMITNYFSLHFAVNFLNSEFYPIQRASIIARNVVVGMSMLATGFSGVISLGLFLLGVTVAVGVLRGELNPNANNLTKSSESLEDR